MGPISIIWMVITGFVVGLLARWVLPGPDHFGFLITSLVGIAGSWVGGYIGSLISSSPAGASFYPAGFVMSVLGAVILLVALRALG